MAKTVVCMKWGKLYGADYVNVLYSALQRNLTGEFRLVCYTDDQDGIREEVESYPLPEINLPERVRWLPWRKIALFRDDLPGLENGTEALFIDLDVVITGSMDELFSYKPGAFCIIENWTQMGQKIGNTTCYRFTVGRDVAIFNELQANPEMAGTTFRNSQRFVSARIGERMNYWPADWCISFKHALLPRWPMRLFVVPKLPPNTRLVAFTGKPDPADVKMGRWPEKKWWKRVYKQVRATPWVAEHHR